jgi:hypothetical protein
MYADEAACLYNLRNKLATVTFAEMSGTVKQGTQLKN